MRRRQAYALQTQLEKAAHLEIPEKVETFVKKITGCQYCGREIRRGLYMHEKYCKAK